MGKSYAETGTGPQNFESFAKQCSKYGYRVPSQEVFTKSYMDFKQQNCQSPSRYFVASYKIYTYGGSLEECPNLTSEEKKFKSKDVKNDAFRAYQLKKSIDELEVKTENAHRNNGKKKYDNGFIADILLRAMYEDNPVSLREKQKAQTEQLKSIIKKYGLYVSDL